MKKDYVQGILFIILAGFFFSLMTLFIRLSGDIPTMQKAFFRNIIALLVSSVLLFKSAEGFSVKKGSFLGLFFRALGGTLGLICNFYAVDKLGLADANMLNKMSPFFAIIFSAFILNERANLVEWGAVIVAFIGAAFIIKPSINITSLNGLVGLFGGCSAGFAYTFVRKLGKQGERGPVIVMFFSAFSCIFTLPFFVIQYVPMSLMQFVCVIMSGVCATGGQFCITKAYTKAPAKEISVFDYSQILFAAILGIIFLNELPDMLSFIGYIIIIGVAVYKWAYNLKRDRA